MLFHRFSAELAYTYLHAESDWGLVEQWDSLWLGVRCANVVFAERYLQLRHKSPSPLNECCRDSKDIVLHESVFQQLK